MHNRNPSANPTPDIYVISSLMSSICIREPARDMYLGDELLRINCSSVSHVVACLNTLHVPCVLQCVYVYVLIEEGTRGFAYSQPCLLIWY